MLGESRRPGAVDDQLIAQCGSMADAVLLCVHLSRFSNAHICGELGIDPGHWSRIMQGRAHFQLNKLQMLMELAGNLAPLQFLMARNGLRVPAPAIGFRNAEAA